MDVACLHGSARRDPHLFFAHGGRADFRGRNGQLYNFFSMPAFSVNVRTEDATFVVRDGLLSVDGSFFTEMHIAALVGWNVQPAAGMQDGSSRLRSGQKWANLSFWASELGEQNWGWRLVNGTCGGHKFKLGKGGYRRCESLEMEVDMASATFSLANWTVSVQGNKVHGWVSGPRHRLDLAFRAKGQGAARYLPHGIVGQSFSTPTPRFGKVDRYPASGHFVTTAMAEGAIDGVAADYEVASPFDTSFSFSRFNAVVQEPLLDPGPLSLLEASAAETVGQEATRRLDEAPGIAIGPSAEASSGRPSRRLSEHQSDCDSDGIPDAEEGAADSDSDGIPDAKESNTADTDSDGLPDAEDPDSDGDGIPDSALPGLGLSEQEVVDAWVYVFGRYLVIRQEHADLSEEGVDYNTIKFNELGKAEFVNPNLDVAYLEAWIAVDEEVPVLLEIPKIEGRYYTAQIMDEWADIITNINERNYPEHPYGKYALCLKGSSPTIPEGALRIDLPSKKAKMLARVERKGDDQQAIALQRAFKATPMGTPKVDPAIEIPSFDNASPISVEAFALPMLEEVLSSAPDKMTLGEELQAKARAIASFVSKTSENSLLIDNLLKEKAFPSLIKFIRSSDGKKAGWVSTTGKPKGFGEDYWFRAAANYAGIWWNNNEEVVYFIGEIDDAGNPLNGDNLYLLRFSPEELPSKHVNSYWSLTLMSLPDYKVVPNQLGRYNFNNLSEFQFEDDGSLRLYMGPQLPDSLPQSNWLPTPKGKPFTLNLRAYVPKEDVISGRYAVPELEKLSE